MNGFEKLLADLSAARVDFIVVGGLAVAFAGYARATEDVDLLVEASTANVQRLLSALEDFGEGHARELDLEDFALEEGAVRIVEAFPLDLFTQMSGRTYEDLLPFTDERAVANATIRHLDAEGLISLKKDSLRPKDRLDVQVLRDLQ
jgi:hypothetical protein